MSIDQILDFLGLTMRAGKVETGESVIVDEIKRRSLKLVIVADDTSNSTAKLVAGKYENYKIPFRKSGSRNGLGIALGRGGRVNVRITDPDLAKKLLSVIDGYRKE